MSDYLQDLQMNEAQIGVGKLRTVVLQFGAILNRFPALAQEVNAMLEPKAGVNYKELTRVIEQQLSKITNFLLDINFLDEPIKSVSEIQKFLQSANTAMSLRTAPMIIERFDKIKSDTEAKHSIDLRKIEEVDKNDIRNTENLVREAKEKVQRELGRAVELESKSKSYRVEVLKKLGLEFSHDFSVAKVEDLTYFFNIENLSTNISDLHHALFNLNRDKLVGHSNWRLPNLGELIRLLNFLGTLENLYAFFPIQKMNKIYIPTNEIFRHSFDKRIYPISTENISLIIKHLAGKTDPPHRVFSQSEYKESINLLLIRNG